MNWLYTNLSYFNEKQQSILIEELTEDAFLSFPESVQSAIKYLVFSLNSNSSASSIQSLFDSIMELLLFEDEIFMFRVNEGQSFDFEVEKTPGQYSDVNIVLRENETGVALSPLDIQPVESGYDVLPVTDLSLSANAVYKINVLLEFTTDGLANGDAKTPVGEVFFVVGEDFDTDGG